MELGYEISNGLSGMMRDLILRLCHLIEMKCEVNENQTVRTIIGMCKEHFAWKTHFHFTDNRFRYMYPLTAFLPNSLGGYTLTQTSANLLKCSFEVCRTIFLDTLLTSSILRWTVQIKYGAPGKRFSLGGAYFSRVNDFHDESLGEYSGTVSFSFWKDERNCPKSILMGVSCWWGWGYGQRIDIYDGSQISVEADAVARKLSFFVNSKRVTDSIYKVKLPLYLGMTGQGRGQSFVSVSLLRLRCATPIAHCGWSYPML